MDSVVTWRDEWLLGIDALDQQHREIVECLNRLVCTCACSEQPDTETMDRKRAEVRSLIDELYEKTKSHFVYEEDLMIREDYPLYSTHAREHVMLLAELKSTFGVRLSEGCCSMNTDILNALKTWFIVHVSRGDRDFANYLLDRHAQRTGVTDP